MFAILFVAHGTHSPGLRLDPQNLLSYWACPGCEELGGLRSCGACPVLGEALPSGACPVSGRVVTLRGLPRSWQKNGARFPSQFDATAAPRARSWVAGLQAIFLVLFELTLCAVTAWHGASTSLPRCAG